MKLLQVRLTGAPSLGFFGNLWLPGSRLLHFRVDHFKSPGSSSLSFYVALLAKIQPDNALSMVLHQARDTIDKALGSQKGNGAEHG